MRTRETQNRDPQPAVKAIYLREAGEHVGPFCSRTDAEKFIELMELFGGSSQGVEIVELDSASAGRNGQKRSRPAAGPVRNRRARRRG